MLGWHSAMKGAVVYVYHYVLHSRFKIVWLTFSATNQAGVERRTRCVLIITSHIQECSPNHAYHRGNLYMLWEQKKKRIFAQGGFLLESWSLFCEKELTITKTFKFKLCNIVFSLADYKALSGTRIINSSSNCFQEPSKWWVIDY